MAIGDNKDFANALKGLEDFEPATLTDKDRRELEIRRPDDDSIRGRVQQALSGNGGDETETPRAAAESLANVETGSLQTVGSNVEGKTPRGVMEPEEASTIGKFLSGVGETLEDPNVQNFIADMGIAFSGGRKNEAGTILGQSVKDTNRAQGVQRVAGQLLEGKPLSEIDTRGMLPDDITTAVGLATQQQQQRTREERTSILQQKANTRDRFASLKSRGLDIEEGRLGLDELKTKSDIKLANAKMDLAEDRLDIENKLNEARVRLFDARAKYYDEEGEISPADEAKLKQISLDIMDRLEAMLSGPGGERTKLEKAEADLKALKERGDIAESGIIGKLFPDTPATRQAVREQSEEWNKRVKETEQFIEDQRSLVQDLEGQLENIRENLSGSDEDEEGSTGGEGEEVELEGTEDNPVTVTSDAEWRSLSPGTVFEANGRRFRKTEGGRVEL